MVAIVRNCVSREVYLQRDDKRLSRSQFIPAGDLCKIQQEMKATVLLSDDWHDIRRPETVSYRCLQGSNRRKRPQTVTENPNVT